MDILVLNNIRLRAVEPDDAELLYQWENDTSIWHLGETIVPLSRQVIREYIENAGQDIYKIRQLRMMIDVCSRSESQTVGAIDLFEFDPYHLRAGIGILIAGKENRRKGYAFTALTILVRYCFEILQLHQVYCSIATDNKPSIALFLKAGFKITGTRKQWLKTPAGYRDQYFLQRINNKSLYRGKASRKA